MIEIRWHGRGGQGSFTAAKLLGIAASLYEGKHALAFPSFGPERRGAPVQAFTKIAGSKIHDRSEIKACDYMVFLDETLVEEGLLRDIKPGGKIVINSKHPGNYEGLQGYDITTLDATSIALEILKRPITNTAMLGAFIGVSGIVDIASAVKGMENYLEQGILEKNIRVLQRSYELCRGDNLPGASETGGAV